MNEKRYTSASHVPAGHVMGDLETMTSHPSIMMLQPLLDPGLLQKIPPKQ